MSKTSSDTAADPGIARFLTDWHRMVAERDLDAIPGFIADDVSMGAPPYWTRFEGRVAVEHLLELILETIEGFTYHREWQNERELALEFTGRVGDTDLQGIDLITLDDTNRVTRLDVLMRPVNAVQALIEVVRPRMLEFLASQNASSS